MSCPHLNTLVIPIPLLCTVTAVVGTGTPQATVPPLQAQPHYCQSCNAQATPYSAQAPQFLAQPPQFQVQPPQFQSQSPQFQSQPPQFQAQPPQLQVQPPQFQSQSPQFQSQPPQLQSQPSRFQAQAPIFDGRSPSCDCVNCTPSLGRPTPLPENISPLSTQFSPKKCRVHTFKRCAPAPQAQAPLEHDLHSNHFHRLAPGQRDNFDAPTYVHRPVPDSLIDPQDPDTPFHRVTHSLGTQSRRRGGYTIDADDLVSDRGREHDHDVLGPGDSASAILDEKLATKNKSLPPSPITRNNPPRASDVIPDDVPTVDRPESLDIPRIYQTGYETSEEFRIRKEKFLAKLYAPPSSSPESEGTLLYIPDDATSVRSPESPGSVAPSVHQTGDETSEELELRIRKEKFLAMLYTPPSSNSELSSEGTPLYIPDDATSVRSPESHVLGLPGPDIPYSPLISNPDLRPETPIFFRDSDTGVQASSQDPPEAQPQDNIARGQASKSKKRQKRVQIDEADEAVPNPRAQDASTARQPLVVPPASPDVAPSSPISVLSQITSHSSVVTRMKVEPPISIDTCFDTLSRAHMLRTVKFTLGSDAADQKHSTGKILRHSLESLTLRTSINPKPLLAALALPSLTHLTLDGDGSLQRGGLGLYQLLKNSRCALTRLYLIDVYPTRAELMRCLRTQACATLERLVVRSTMEPYARPNVDAGTLRDLARVGVDGGLLCPKLDCLELSYCDCSAKDFVRMVKKRVERGRFKVRYAFSQRGAVSGEVAKELGALAEKWRDLKYKEILGN